MQGETEMRPEGETPPEQAQLTGGNTPTAQAGEAPSRRAPRRAPRTAAESETAEHGTEDSADGVAEPEATPAASVGDEAGPPPAAVLRAEQLLDEALVWGAALGTVLAQRARKLVARAREELEDIVAEAEAVRSQWRREFRRRTESHR